MVGPAEIEVGTDEVETPVVVAFALTDITPVPLMGAEWVCVMAVEFSEQVVVYVVNWVLLREVKFMLVVTGEDVVES